MMAGKKYKIKYHECMIEKLKAKYELKKVYIETCTTVQCKEKYTKKLKLYLVMIDNHKKMIQMYMSG